MLISCFDAGPAKGARRRGALRAALCSTLAILFVLFFSLPVFAQGEQGEPPLRLVYLNAAGSTGANSFRAIERILDGSDQIELLSPREFLSQAEMLGLDTESFRQSETRAESIDEFAEAMARANVEGLLVHDVFGGGNTLQVVVIGPRGWEIADIRRTIRRGRIEEDQTIEVLREVFAALVPEVRGFRREAQEAAGQARQEDRRATTPPRSLEPEVDLRAQAVEAYRARRGYLKPTLALRVGGLFGYRSMRLDQPSGSFVLNHATPLTGVSVRAEAIIATFEGDTSGLEATGYFGFSPFSTTFGTEVLPGQFLTGAGDLRYVYLFSAQFRAHFLGGVDFMNLSLAANSQYTGHGYLSGRLGAGIEYTFGSLMKMRLDALFLPLIVTSNSGGAYGDTISMFGYGADGGIDIHHFEPFLVSLNYGLRRFELEYPDPDILDSSARSLDMIHQVQLSVGYRF